MALLEGVSLVREPGSTSSLSGLDDGRDRAGLLRERAVHKPVDDKPESYKQDGVKPDERTNRAGTEQSQRRRPRQRRD